MEIKKGIVGVVLIALLGTALDAKDNEKSVELEEEYTLDKSYFSLSAGYLAQSGPGSVQYRNSSGDSVTDSTKVSGDGFDLKVNYTFFDILRLYIGYKNLTTAIEDDFDLKLENIDTQDFSFGFLAVEHISKNFDITYGAFLGGGSSKFESGDNVGFLSYGPEIGFAYNIIEMVDVFADLTWTARVYEKNNDVKFANTPFGAEFGFRVNFR